MEENYSILDRKCKECGKSPARYERCGKDKKHHRRTCTDCVSRYMARLYQESDRKDLYKPRAMKGVMARPPLVKRCRRCDEVKRIADFRYCATATDGRQSYCKQCVDTNREERRQRSGAPDLIAQRDANRRFKERLEPYREMVYQHYGNACHCCGETIRDFLTIEHLNNDGNVHRKTKNRMTGILKFKEIADSGMPADLAIACYNCNSGRARTPDKICPHQTARQSLLKLVS